ncbi:MAG TPA: PLD nuclease N-terminal domain-containing protein [Ktedonobacteraceae bacterium]|nr:PLD nuclease N-terminal domain-containing protein [Ktedonobacteraceae bacterium]
MYLFLGEMSKVPLESLLPLLIPLAVLELLLIAFALIDLIRREPERVNGSKIMWALIIVLISTLGPILYLVVGRKEQSSDLS